MKTIAIAVKPKEYYDKPGKNEVVTYFKICPKGCNNCDTKRSLGCCKPS